MKPNRGSSGRLAQLISLSTHGPARQQPLLNRQPKRPASGLAETPEALPHSLAAERSIVGQARTSAPGGSCPVMSLNGVSERH